MVNVNCRKNQHPCSNCFACHELVKLQDWVVANGHKIVILFEERDAAGKGGVIKRITQRLDPRVCRVAALSAPNDRERTQWYFQRYARTCQPRAN